MRRAKYAMMGIVLPDHLYLATGGVIVSAAARPFAVERPLDMFY
jgi:hypothetical protein